MGLAVFDIDGTLVTGASTERRLFRALLGQGWIGPRQLGAFLAFAARHAADFGGHVFRKNKAYLVGRTPGELAGFVREWVPRALPPAWFGPAVARLEAHLAAGDDVVLLSGTPDFLAQAIARQLRATAGIGTRCAERSGRFSVAPPLRHPFGAAKLAIVGDLCRSRGLTLADITAYGDSVHDLPLLRSVGRPVAVRPDGALSRVASRERWDVLPVMG